MFGKAIRSVVAGGVLALAAVVFAVPSWAAVSKRPTPTPTATPAPAQVQWGQFQLNSLHTAAAEGSIRPPLQQVWRARTPGTTAAHGSSGPVIAGDIAIAEGASTVYAMNLSAGELAWQIPRKVGPISTPAVATIGGRDVFVYTEGATSSDSAAVAIDIADRSELWRQPLKAVSASGVSVSGGEVYLGDRSGNLYAFSLTDGTSASWAPAGLGGGAIDAPPAASSGAVVVTERDHDTGAVKVEAVDPSSGNDLWNLSTSVSAGTATTPTLDESHAVVGIGGEQFVRAIALSSTDTADTSWTAHTRSTFSPLSAAAEADGKVFIVSTSSSDAALYALDTADGSKLWDFQFQEAAVETSPIVAGGTVYVGTEDGVVAGIDVASGLEVWEGQTGSGAIGPLAASSDMLVASKRGEGGGLVAFRFDPNGTLLHVESSTTLHLGTVLGRYAIAFAIVFGLVYGGVYAARRRLASGAAPEDADAHADDAPPDEPDGA